LNNSDACGGFVTSGESQIAYQTQLQFRGRHDRLRRNRLSDPPFMRCRAHENFTRSRVDRASRPRLDDHYSLARGRVSGFARLHAGIESEQRQIMNEMRSVRWALRSTICKSSQ
jgi:hypothetical protein